MLETGGHSGPVPLLFFTADSKELITVSTDDTIRCWDMEVGELKRVLRPPGPRGSGSAVAPDRKTLALSDWHNILLMNLEDGRIRSFPFGSRPETTVGPLAFSADGKRLAAGTTNNHEAAVFDVATGKRLHTFNTGDHVQTAVGFSPDGRILTAFREFPELLNLATGKADHIGMPTHDCFAWSPDSRGLAAGNSAGIDLYDVATKKLLKYLPVGPTRSIVFLPGGKELLTTGTLPKEVKSRVNIVDARTGKELMRFISPVPWMPHAEYADLSPDGRLVASSNGPAHIVYVWQRSDGKLLHTFRAKGTPFYAAAWRDDGKAIAWTNRFLNPAEGGKDYLSRRPLTAAFDLAELRFLGKPDPKDYRRAVHKQGGTTLLVEGDTRSKTVIRDGKTFHLQTDDRNYPLVGTLLANDRVLLGYGPWLVLHDLNARAYFDKPNNRYMIGKEVFTAVNDEVTDIAPSPDNRYVLTASRDQILRIWRAEPKRLALHLSLFIAGPDWIAWTPEGYYAATPGGERLMGWAVNNGRNTLQSFYPADRFRKQLYRPDVVKLILDKGSLREALAAANAARKQGNAPEAAGPTAVEDLLPPRVALQVIDRKGDKTTVKASAIAAAPGQPVTGMRLLLDGRPFPDQQSVTVAEFAKGQAKAEAQWSITLPEGTHQLAVLAQPRCVRGLEPGCDRQRQPSDPAGAARAGRRHQRLSGASAQAQLCGRGRRSDSRRVCAACRRPLSRGRAPDPGGRPGAQAGGARRAGEAAPPGRQKTERPDGVVFRRPRHQEQGRLLPADRRGRHTGSGQNDAVGGGAGQGPG